MNGAKFKLTGIFVYNFLIVNLHPIPTGISGKAGPANVKTAEFGERETEYALEWVAESITEITAFQVQLAEGLHGTPFDTEVR